MTTQTTELTEEQKRDRDMLVYGTGAMKDDKHVPIEQVRDLDTEPLKPCPFCGYEHPFMSVRTNENGRFFDVTCGNCGVQHDLHDSVAAVVEAWNMRAA